MIFGEFAGEVSTSQLLSIVQLYLVECVKSRQMVDSLSKRVVQVHSAIGNTGSA